MTATKADDAYDTFSESLANYRRTNTISDWFVDFCIKIDKLNLANHSTKRIKYNDGSYIVIKHAYCANNSNCYTLIPYDLNGEITKNDIALDDANMVISEYEIASAL